MSRIGHGENCRIRELLARFALGQNFARDAIEWACALLVKGADTKHLRLLAGYSAAEAEKNPEEFRADFTLTLKELNIDLPPRREAFSDSACFICRSYLEGAVSCNIAHAALYRIWVDTNYHPQHRIDDRFEVWMYLADSRSLVAEGYKPLLERFSGLNESNYEEFFRREVVSFLAAYEVA